MKKTEIKYKSTIKDSTQLRISMINFHNPSTTKNHTNYTCLHVTNQNKTILWSTRPLTGMVQNFGLKPNN